MRKKNFKDFFLFKIFSFRPKLEESNIETSSRIVRLFFNEDHVYEDDEYNYDDDEHIFLLFKLKNNKKDKNNKITFLFRQSTTLL